LKLGTPSYIPIAIKISKYRARALSLVKNRLVAEHPSYEGRPLADLGLEIAYTA
jgi:hypothetical protein